MSDTATPQGAAPQGQAAAGQAAGSDADLASQIAATIDRRDDDAPLGASDALDDGSDEAPQQRQASNATPDPEPSSPSQSDAADPELTVKIDGQEKRIKQSDLVAHYQKGQAAEKRFEEAAGLRKQVEQHQTQVNAERSALGQALQHYTQQLQALQQQGQPDWQSLLESDPTEFVRQRYAFDQRQQQLQQAQAAQAYLQQQQRADSERTQVERLKSEAGRLLDVLPDWRDAGKAAEGRKAIRSALQAAGFSDGEMDGITDHRAVLIAHKAAMYDQLIAQQKASLQALPDKLQKLPPVQMERPGGGERLSPTDGRTKAMQRLSRTGSARDAAAVIAGLL
jgi:hypothetical protein